MAQMEPIVSAGRGAQGGHAAFNRSAWAPAVDVFETGDACFVVAEIGGVAHDAVHVELSSDRRTVTLTGRRSCRVPAVPAVPPGPATDLDAAALTGPASQDGDARCGGAVRCHQLEIPTGRFERRVLLPCAADGDAADATYRDGLLEVRLPKARPQGPVRVDVRTHKSLRTGAAALSRGTGGRHPDSGTEPSTTEDFAEGSRTR